MINKTFSIETSTSFSYHAITAEDPKLVHAAVLKEGLVNVFSRHTTTALIINEIEERLIMDI